MDEHHVFLSYSIVVIVAMVLRSHTKNNPRFRKSQGVTVCACKDDLVKNVR